MKALKKIVMILAALLLLFACLVAALNVIFNDTGWLREEYSRKLPFVESYYGISPEDSARVLSRMMYYSIGRADDLYVTITQDGREVLFFNQKELDHMKDVRKLATTVMWMGMIALIVSAAAIVLFAVLKQKDALRTGAKAFLIALAVLVFLLIGFGIWIAVDFDSFWTAFHVVFLDLESSTFNPAASRMIRICPGELFSDFIARFAVWSAVFVGAAAAACAVFLIVTRRKKCPTTT